MYTWDGSSRFFRSVESPREGVGRRQEGVSGRPRAVVAGVTAESAPHKVPSSVGFLLAVEWSTWGGTPPFPSALRSGPSVVSLLVEGFIQATHLGLLGFRCWKMVGTPA